MKKKTETKCNKEIQEQKKQEVNERKYNKELAIKKKEIYILEFFQKRK